MCLHSARAFHYIAVMKTKVLGSCMAVSTLALLFVSCESTQRVASAEKRWKTPPAQNVHQYEGGEIVRQIQQKGGVGFDANPGNAMGGIRP